MSKLRLASETRFAVFSLSISFSSPLRGQRFLWRSRSHFTFICRHVFKCAIQMSIKISIHSIRVSNVYGFSSLSPVSCPASLCLLFSRARSSRSCMETCMFKYLVGIAKPRLMLSKNLSLFFTLNLNRRRSSCSQNETLHELWCETHFVSCSTMFLLSEIKHKKKLRTSGAMFLSYSVELTNTYVSVAWAIRQYGAEEQTLALPL